MKRDEVLKTVNVVLKCIIVVSGVVGIVCHFSGVRFDFLPWLPGSFTKLPSYIGTIVLAFVPEILRLFRVYVSDGLATIFYLFLIPAMVLGIDLDWYRTMAEYDKVVHFGSGILAAMVAKEIVDNAYSGSVYPTLTEREAGIKGRQHRVYDRRFVGLIIMGIVGLTAVCWESFEFLYDTFTGGTMQELVSNGVADTMWDMIMALIGGGVATIVILWCYRKKVVES